MDWSALTRIWVKVGFGASFGFSFFDTGCRIRAAATDPGVVGSGGGGGEAVGGWGRRGGIFRGLPGPPRALLRPLKINLSWTGKMASDLGRGGADGIGAELSFNPIKGFCGGGGMGNGGGNEWLFTYALIWSSEATEARRPTIGGFGIFGPEIVWV